MCKEKETVYRFLSTGYDGRYNFLICCHSQKGGILVGNAFLLQAESCKGCKYKEAI